MRKLSKRIIGQSVLDMGVDHYLNPEVWSTMSKEYYTYQDPKLYDQQTLDNDKNNTYAIKNEFENVPGDEEDERDKNKMWILDLNG
jgi:hypothetical protein